MQFSGPEPDNDIPARTGILLINLGTPDSTSVGDVRRYLKQFLSDPRVIETPRLLWWLILNGVILRIRPARSAAAYRKVWTEQGSPLLFHTQAIAEKLEKAVQDAQQTPVSVVTAMRYGQPSIADGLEQLRQKNARRILVLPLYPQYSASTTASTFDEISRVLRGWRWIPELRFINHYHDQPGYIKALANSVRDYWNKNGEPDRLLLSFHGIPQSYQDKGDPYGRECNTTARLIAEQLGLADDQWSISFQSRVGTQVWLKPYTDETLKQWGAEGVGRVDVVCPGFPADCLETIEEIGEENRDYFLEAGGKSYHYIPSLNSSDAHIESLKELTKLHLWQDV
ncbi:MAG: ferrochelatase [Sedimenticola thiotaurini]|uniref:Ferrochelatase n=1 Tax=Sedimenticola thiotaurini TaxID=1543721 RepID=A0A558CSF2_9GAMM|nr:MAG: ferrochelatase [Sedimenticola thiotaurini]